MSNDQLYATILYFTAVGILIGYIIAKAFG